MTIGAIVTGGYGTPGSIAGVVTRGYLGSSDPTVPGTDFNSGGGPIKGVTAGRTFPRERFEKLASELQRGREAQAKLKKRAEYKSKEPRRKALKEASEEADRIIRYLQSILEVNPQILAGIASLNQSLEAAIEARLLSDAMNRAEESKRLAAELYDLILRQQDEDDVIALLLA